MRRLGRWFGLWERHKVVWLIGGEWGELTFWLRPWDGRGQEEVRRGVRALRDAGSSALLYVNDQLRSVTTGGQA